ncbi:MAG: HAMP domain-containing protein [Chitinivibrionales bacterium]|nr:HAMP domain-containing protein [Chitinivibrionales bacterium]
MKTSISSKLFLGFLVVIFLNVLFVVVVSRFADLYGIARMLGCQNAMKNSLLRIESLHGNQRTNMVILDKLGRRESYVNFSATAREVTAQLDSLRGSLHAVRNVDTAIAASSATWQIRNALNRLDQAVMDDLAGTVHTYNALVDTFAAAKLETPRAGTPRLDSLSRAIGALSDTLIARIRSTELQVDNLTRLRLADIERRIENGRTTTMFIVAGVSLFALVFAFLFSHVITTALRRLKQSVSRMGEGVLHFDARGYPEDEIGELAGAFSTMADNLRSAQEELVQSKRLAAIGQVVASVNHEINNPLMIISGNAQLLEMALANDPEQSRRAQTIVEEAERISAVTRKLRDMRNPVVENYTASGNEEMINIEKSSQESDDEVSGQKAS